MRYRTIYTLLLGAVCCFAFAQDSSTSGHGLTKWEYKAISLLADGGRSSRFGSQYSSAGSEAKSVLPKAEHLNMLGARGWEMVGLYLEMETAFPNFAQGDTVQGLKSNIRPQDLVLIFKRPLDSERTKREAIEDAQAAQTLAQEQMEAAKKELEEAAKPNSAVLIDLDEVDLVTAIAERRITEEKRLKEAISSVTGYKFVSVLVRSSASTPTESQVDAWLEIDGTEKLLKDVNKFRKKEAVALAQELAHAIFAKSDLRTFDMREVGAMREPVRIHVNVMVMFNGKLEKVSEAATGGSWKHN